jgi:branched-chain amino acid transport system substrate-binding protein
MCALLLTLASCGAGGSSTSARHLVIATLFDVSGTDAAFDLPAQYGVDLAVRQAHLPDGYTVRVVHEDYGGTTSDDPTVRANAARAVTAEVQALANNAQVVGMVGPFNSYVAALTMPITNLAGLSMISPANTTPGLTLQQYALPQYGFNWSLLHPAGHPDRFFQLAANEVELGQVDAYIASHLLGAKTAFVLENDTIAYNDGQGNYDVGNPNGELAQSFTSAFTSIPGHTLVSSPVYTCLVACTGSLASAILAKNPDVVFYAGSAYDGGAELKRVLVAAGYTKPLLGGDGIANEPAWLSVAGAGAGNTFATMALPDVSALTSPRARALVSAYETFVA